MSGCVRWYAWVECAVVLCGNVVSRCKSCVPYYVRKSMSTPCHTARTTLFRLDLCVACCSVLTVIAARSVRHCPDEFTASMTNKSVLYVLLYCYVSRCTRKHSQLRYWKTYA